MTILGEVIQNPHMKNGGVGCEFKELRTDSGHVSLWGWDTPLGALIMYPIFSPKASSTTSYAENAMKTINPLTYNYSASFTELEAASANTEGWVGTMALAGLVSNYALGHSPVVHMLYDQDDYCKMQGLAWSNTMTASRDGFKAHYNRAINGIYSYGAFYDSGVGCYFLHTPRTPAKRLYLHKVSGVYLPVHTIDEGGSTYKESATNRAIRNPFDLHIFTDAPSLTVGEDEYTFAAVVAYCRGNVSLEPTTVTLPANILTGKTVETSSTGEGGLTPESWMYALLAGSGSMSDSSRHDVQCVGRIYLDIKLTELTAFVYDVLGRSILHATRTGTATSYNTSLSWATVYNAFLTHSYSDTPLSLAKSKAGDEGWQGAAAKFILRQATRKFRPSIERDVLTPPLLGRGAGYATTPEYYEPMKDKVKASGGTYASPFNTIVNKDLYYSHAQPNLVQPDIFDGYTAPQYDINVSELYPLRYWGGSMTHYADSVEIQLEHDLAAPSSIGEVSVTNYKMLGRVFDERLGWSLGQEGYYQGSLELHGVAVANGVPFGNVPVFLYDRGSGELVRSTTSDAQGRYSFYGLPKNIDYYAVGIDRGKTYNCVSEEFGVLTND